jgi:sterol desaturase/sphingolipid hydroxylase (fatty acid hydroxylase superfamily)
VFLHLVERIATFLGQGTRALLLSPGSSFSIASLLSALCIAITVVLVRRRPGKKVVGYRVMFRALFPNWLRRRSFRADIWFLVLNVFAFGVMFGWTLISTQYVSGAVAGALTRTFGVPPTLAMHEGGSRVLVTVFLFLAYELAYWFDHYLSHRVAFLWEFHKVHHTAEVLSPLTNFRVHPVDSIVFSNIVALIVGPTAGVLAYLHFGNPFVVDGTNVILIGFVFLTVHLQHSHVWLAVTGAPGRLILSPAHHQIHHSDNPIHFDKNFGSCLSIWDWVFGTLHMPRREREYLTFGVETRAAVDHTARGSLFLPFVRAWNRLPFPRLPSRQLLSKPATPER